MKDFMEEIANKSTMTSLQKSLDKFTFIINTIYFALSFLNINFLICVLIQSFCWMVIQAFIIRKDCVDVNESNDLIPYLPFGALGFLFFVLGTFLETKDMLISSGVLLSLDVISTCIVFCVERKKFLK